MAGSGATATPHVASIKASPSSGTASDAAREIEATITSESAKLALAYASKREALQAVVSAQSVAIVNAAMAEHAATIAALTQREQVVRGVFAAARASVATTQNTQIALVRGEVATALLQMHTGSSGIAGQVRVGAQREADRMQTAARDAAQMIQASGGTLRSEIIAYPIGNFRSTVADLEPDEMRQVESALGEAKRGAAGAVLSSDSENAAKLNSTAAENGNAFSSVAGSIIDQVNAKLPETEQSIRAAGEAVTAVIERMAASQLAAMDAAERQVMAQLADARAHTVNVLHAGHAAAGDLRAHAGSQVAALTTQETAARQQLHAAGTQASAQLAGPHEVPRAEAHAFAGKVATSLRQDSGQHLAALDHVIAPALAQLGGAAAAFSSAIRGRRDRMLTVLDAAISGAGTVLAQGLGELAHQCTSVRGEATATYAAAEAQLATSANPGIQSAQETWRAKADDFVASCRAYQSEAVGKHAQVRAELPAKMTAVAHDTVAELRRSTARRVWDGIKSGVGSIAQGLVVFVAAVIVVAAIVMAFIGTAFFGLATAIAVLVVGAAMLAVALVTSFINRLRMLWNNDWPWLAKLVGIPAAFGVAIGDTLGISQIMESLRGRELISERGLSIEERSALTTQGIFQILTLGLIKKITSRRGRGGGRSGHVNEKPPLADEKPALTDENPALAGEKPPLVNEKPPLVNERPPLVDEKPPLIDEKPPLVDEKPPLVDEKPPLVDEKPPLADERPPLDPQLPPDYDPTARTTTELQFDRIPTVRAGETHRQARARVRAAESEIVRRANDVFDALGTKPREVNPRLEDKARKAENAHTTGDEGCHGADIPLRRAESPGGKTIEGRLFGDSPWKRQAPTSMRWTSDSTMVRVINEYIRTNWNQIRTDLALNGNHTGGGDAGAAIGEGFINVGTASAPRPILSVTSLFKVTILLSPGPPPDFFVLTGFPAATGIR